MAVIDRVSTHLILYLYQKNMALIPMKINFVYSLSIIRTLLFYQQEQKHVTHQMWPTEVDRVEPLTEPDELIHLLVGIVDSLLENVYTVVRTVLSQT